MWDFSTSESSISPRSLWWRQFKKTTTPTHLCSVTKERCKLNRAYWEMINRSGNSAGGNSNQKLSLQDTYGTWWEGFLQSHGDVHIWAGHPKLLSQTVEPMVWDSSHPGADTHIDLTNHTPKVAISPHWAVEGAWAEDFIHKSLHRTLLESSRGQILSFLPTLKENWFKPNQINKSWNFS